jgi:hypothetical protein
VVKQPPRAALIALSCANPNRRVFCLHMSFRSLRVVLSLLALTGPVGDVRV